MNVLYDKNHYKLALGQVNTAKHLIDSVSKDYVRLLKFGDSLYRCKQLKRAALGRMATIMKRQKEPLAYLEQVRQHLARLPSIDPNTRTLLICGYPNVGKSSFINKITRADVDVQPYAFTTKSLFVGHMDYKYLRWQVIDTPGILDHPLEEMNTIEMQSITALAHLRACIMYFMDLSEQCGYTIEAQVKLFHSIKPLFANKPVLLVVNKIDQVKPEDLEQKNAALLQEIIDSGVQMVTTSCYTDIGVQDVKQTACDKLLAARVDFKMKGAKVNDILNKLHLAQPALRDEVERPAFIPEEVQGREKYDVDDPMRRRLEKDIEQEEGGAGVYNYNLKKKYMLADDGWKMDKIPELLDGRNVYDFVDPDIEEKLEALEREEEKLEAEGYYNSEEEMLNSEDEEIRQTAAAIREKKSLAKLAAQSRKVAKNRPVMPRKTLTARRNASEMASQLASVGLDASGANERGRSRSVASVQRKRKADAMEIDGAESMDVDGSTTRSKSVARSRSAVRDRSVMGMRDGQKSVTEKIKKKNERMRNRMAKAGESDRAIQVKRPKHLFSGKAGMGGRDRR